MTAIPILLLMGLWAQDAPPPAEPAVVEEPPAGFWPTERMAEMMLKRWASDAADRYQLDETQHGSLEEMLFARWPEFMKKNRRQLQPVINSFIESRLDPDPPEEGAVQDWAKQALPIFNEARTLIGEINDEFRQILRPEQIGQFEAEVKMMNMGIGWFGERLARWEKGEFEENEFTGRGSRRGRRERQREARQEEARLAEREAADAGDQILAELNKWDRYLEDFILRFRLDETQRVAARSIRREIRERAMAHRARHKDEIVSLERRMKTPDAKEDEIAEKLRELYGPIDQLFGEFEQRLDRLPTESQRIAAAAEASKASSPELAPTERTKLQELGYVESPSGTSEQRH